MYLLRLYSEKPLYETLYETYCIMNAEQNKTFCQKVLSVVCEFKNIRDRSATKNYGPVSLLSVVSKILEKPVNNSSFGRLKPCGFFSDFCMVLDLLDQLQILDSCT